MNTAQLTAALDATGEPWNLWRAANTGHWYVLRGERINDPGSRTLSGKEIDEALQAALNSKRLPVIPRRPKLCYYSYEKQGTGPRPYKVTRDGIAIQQMDRKRKAVERVRLVMSYQEHSIDQWVTAHAHFVDTHTEGVDFYYAK